MCHAATWLINGVRDGHGNFWKLYARKSTLAHPELPMVTRCHSYDIKYKFQYQCTRCQNTYVWLNSDELNLLTSCFCINRFVFKLPLCVILLYHDSPQDRPPFQVTGHTKVRVCSLHWSTCLTGTFQAACSYAFCQLCQRELWDCATNAGRTKPCRSDA